MSSGLHERGGAVLESEAKSVRDLAAGGFVVAHEPRENRQAGGVGGSPRERALRVILQIPHGGGACVPRTIGIDAGTIEFVEPAIVVVEDQDVAVARSGIGVTLDVGIYWNWHGSGI